MQGRKPLHHLAGFLFFDARPWIICVPARSMSRTGFPAAAQTDEMEVFGPILTVPGGTKIRSCSGDT